MLNTALNLSKLSRGKGERKGSLIEIVYDDQVTDFLNYIFHFSIKCYSELFF